MVMHDAVPVARGWLLAGVVLTLVACGGGGGGSSPSAGGTGGGNGGGPQLPDPASAPAMKTVFSSNYLVGAAIPPDFTTGPYSTVLIKHMSSLTAENAMKPDTIQPSLAGSPDQPAALNFAPADTIVNFAMANGIKMRGHTLLWYYTAPDWFFAGCSHGPRRLPARRAPQASRLHLERGAALRRPDLRLGRGERSREPRRRAPPRRIAPTGRGTRPMRRRRLRAPTCEPWDYIEDAFRDADEARTSLGLTSADMKLMINEYNTELPGKRANLVRIIQDLRNKGVAVDGVGHQFHLRLDADVTEVTAALVGHRDPRRPGEPGDRARREHLCRPGLAAVRPAPGCIANYGAIAAAVGAVGPGAPVPRAVSPPSSARACSR